jgi:hypothetical protein
VEGGYIKEKEENSVCKCSHVLILLLNLEGTKFNKMQVLHIENSCEHGQDNIKHNCKSKMHAYEHTWNIIF